MNRGPHSVVIQEPDCVRFVPTDPEKPGNQRLNHGNIRKRIMARSSRNTGKNGRFTFRISEA